MFKLRDWIDKDNIDWELMLCLNPLARALSEHNHYIIDWEVNPSAEEIALLEKNPDEINWFQLSQNPCASALQLLENNQDKIWWDALYTNPAIFVYDYEGMKDAMDKGIKEDLMKNRFHPRNIPKFRDWGFEDYECDE